MAVAMVMTSVASLIKNMILTFANVVACTPASRAAAALNVAHARARQVLAQLGKYPNMKQQEQST